MAEVAVLAFQAIPVCQATAGDFGRAKAASTGGTLRRLVPPSTLPGRVSTATGGGFGTSVLLAEWLSSAITAIRRPGVLLGLGLSIPALIIALVLALVAPLAFSRRRVGRAGLGVNGLPILLIILRAPGSVQEVMDA